MLLHAKSIEFIRKGQRQLNKEARRISFESR